MMKRIIYKTSNKGAITIEAAVILPVILSFILSILFFIRVIGTYQVMQHALNNAANEISTYSYLYSASGLQRLHDDTKEALNTKSSLIEEDISLITEGLNAFGATASAISSSDKHVGQSLLELCTAGSSVVQSAAAIQETIVSFEENPAEQALGLGSLIAEGMLEEAKSKIVLQPVALFLISKSLKEDNISLDTRLRQLCIADGINGIDLSGSTLFKDKRTIDLMIKYKIKLPTPIKLFPEFYIIQRANVAAWLDGDGVHRYKGEQEVSEEASSGGWLDVTYDNQDSADESKEKKNRTVWDLPPKERGRIIQKQQGRNLPDMFPVISKISNGTVYSIKSIDTSDITYKKRSNLKYRISGFIKELKEFERGSCKGVTIESGDYREKTLVIVVPRDSHILADRGLYYECMSLARANNIGLQIIEHQEKKTEE